MAQEMKVGDKVEFNSEYKGSLKGIRGEVFYVDSQEVRVVFPQGNLRTEARFPTDKPIPLKLVEEASPRGQFIDLRLNMEEANIVLIFLSTHRQPESIVGQIYKRLEAILNVPEQKEDSK